ncbi:MAG: type II secretion system F family protein, partial [Planctomycetota bacterium]
MKFAYEGSDRSGQQHQGELEATSEAEATAMLSREGIQAHSLSPTTTHLDLLPSCLTSSDETAHFCEQLARLTEAEIPLPKALASLANDSTRPAFRTALERMAQGLEQGRALEDLLGEERHIFPDLLPTMVLAGKESGHLPETLRLAAQHAWRFSHLRSQFFTALAYPLLVLLLLIIIMAGVLTQIVPQARELFVNMNASLPGLTLLLFWMADHTTAILGSFLGVGILAALSQRYHIPLPGQSVVRGWLSHHVPLLGRMMKSMFL